MKRKEEQKQKRLKQLTSSQAFSPIQDVRNGIIITKDGRFIKLMEVSPINFSLRSALEQDAIISNFASALKVAPKLLHFKVVSRRADVSKFVSNIRKEQRTETNENCRNLQEEQIKLIQDIGTRESVTRRFFIDFQYEQTAGLQVKPNFDQITYSLNGQAQRIASALLQCGNEIVSSDNDDGYTMEALYSIMCRAKSEYISFEDHFYYDVVSRYLAEDGTLSADAPVIPVNDFICPESIDDRMSPQYMVIDGLYYTFAYIPSGSYPLRAYAGWARMLIDLYAGVDVDFWIEKEDTATVQSKLSFRLRYNKMRAKESDDTSSEYDDLMNAIESGYYLKNGISSNDEFCYFSTMLTITGHSLEELKWKYEEIKQSLIARDMRLKPCYFKQKDAFLATLPICKYDAGIFAKSRRNALISSMASIYPFVSFEMTDENGILLGTNTSNDSLVFLDSFDTKKYKNANYALLGTTGAGKTFTLQTIALRLRAKKTRTFILAPIKGKEFKRACDAVGGQFIQLSPGSGQCINIMEIRKHNTTTDELLNRTSGGNNSILAKKVQTLHTFFSLLIPDITHEERQLLDEALIRTYEKYGITSKNKSLWDPARPGKYRKMPVLGDLHKELAKNEKTSRMYNILTRYVTGSAASFNQQTNVNLDNLYIVLDMSDLTKEMLPVGMFIALDYVKDKVMEDPTVPKAVIMDEIWELIGAKASIESAEFVLEFFKTCRAYFCSAIAATQDLNDFFALDDGRFGKGIINNAKTKIIMQLEPEEAGRVQETLHLTNAEIKRILNLPRGVGLLAANTNHVFVNFKASAIETELITTDPRELAKIVRRKKIEMGITENK